MEQRRSKRILYSICFICLGFIDWIRGSQTGVYWLTAINLTGVFVSIVTMSHFRWKTEPKKVYLCWLAIWLLGSLAGYGIWRIHPGAVYLSQYWSAAISVCFVGIAGLRIWRERRQIAGNQLGNHVLLACWVVLSVLMSCSRMGEIWPVWYLVIFGLFYMVPFSAEERKNLWDGLVDGLIITFFCLQIYAYGFRPYDELRYKGAFGNCNMNALFYMVTYIALLYRSHSLRWQEMREKVAVTWKRKIVKLILWMLTAGIWGFVFLTMTRTALLALVAITIVYGVIEFRVICGEQFFKILARGVALFLGVVLTFPVVYLTVRYLPTILHHPIWFDGEYSVNKVHSFDPADSEKYVSFDELFGGLGERLEKSVEDASAVSVESLEFTMLEQEEQMTPIAGNSDEALDETQNEMTDEIPNEITGEGNGETVQTSENYLLTGEAALSSTRIRLEIYKLYLKHMNLTGHELQEGYFQITEDYHAWHAQNIFLQIGFYHGVIAGILFVVLMAGLGVQSLRLVIRRRSCEDMLPILVGLLFVGYGMLECVWYPGQTILLLIYLIPKIMIDSRGELTNR